MHRGPYNSARACRDVRPSRDTTMVRVSVTLLEFDESLPLLTELLQNSVVE